MFCQLPVDSSLRQLPSCSIGNATHPSFRTAKEIYLLTNLLCPIFFVQATSAVASLTATAPHDSGAMFQATSASSGIISTVAGFNRLSEGSKADGIPANDAQLLYVTGVVLDKEGNLLISLLGDNKIRKVTISTGIITTVVGTGIEGFAGDGGQAALAVLNRPEGVTIDSSGNIFFADSNNHRIRKVTISTGVITTVAGNGDKVGSSIGDNGPATSARLSRPQDVALDSSGNIFIADSTNGRIRKVTASTGIITTIAGNGLLGGDDPVATEYALFAPTGVTLDALGNVYIAGNMDSCIFKVTLSTGLISIVAGTGKFSETAGGFNGDDKLATKSELNRPNRVAIDSSGNMYISDSSNNRVRKVTATTGIMTTIAGTGKNKGTDLYAGDSGSATLAPIGLPSGIAIDSSGNIYFCEYENNVVKKITYTDSAPSTSTTPAPSADPASSPTAKSAPTITVFKSPSLIPSAFTSKSPTVPSAPSSAGATTPTAPSSAAPATSPTGTTSSARRYIAETLHLLIMLLTSLLILKLCRDA